MAHTLKTIVSKKKQRYVRDGYNLDLSYINDRIIAMGFPADNIEALFRNSADEVKKFLDDKHLNHYKIYNLCSEKIYDVNKFYGRVAHYPFDDHHPPNFSMISPFCQDIQSWLDEDPRNVAAVHCKAGKGRTGVMICCYLLHSRVFTDAQGVLDFYGQKRTLDAKGVTIPSQRRYIHYYDRLLQRSLVYKSVKLYLRCIVLDPVPIFGNIVNDCLLSFTVTQRCRPVPYESNWYIMKRIDRQVRLEVDPPLLLSDDVKIEFMTKPRLDYVGINPKHWRKSHKEFHFWLNTFFVDAEMDGGLAHDILTHDAESGSEHAAAGAEGEEPISSGSSGVQNPNFNPFFAGSKNSGLDDGDERPDETKTIPKISDLRRMSEHSATESLPVAYEMLDPNFRHLMPAPHHQTVVGMASLLDKGANVNSVSEMIRLSSMVDESHPKEHQETYQRHLLPHDNNRNGQASHPHVTFPSSISNASSSSSSSVSLTAPSSGNLMSVASTNTSFIEKRTRHASVPQTSSSPGALSHLLPHTKKTGHSSAQRFAPSAPSCRSVSIDGTNIALRLKKSQIDKANKDKQCKVFRENFNVTLFLTKPRDQSDELPDYSLLVPHIAQDNFHHITVTPVTPTSENLTDKKKGKGTKGKSKGKISMKNLQKRGDSSSDDDECHEDGRQHLACTQSGGALPKYQSIKAITHVRHRPSSGHDVDGHASIPPVFLLGKEESPHPQSDWI